MEDQERPKKGRSANLEKRYKRNDLERERDYRDEADMFLRGMSYRNIAEAMNAKALGYTLTHAQVAYDVRAMIQQWEKERHKMIDYHKTLELAKIERLEREYWDAWEKSKGMRKREITTRSGPIAAPTHITQAKTEEDSPGDPRYLQGIQWCSEQRVRILGLEAKEPDEGVPPGGMLPTVRRIEYHTRTRNRPEPGEIQEAEVIE